MSAETVNQDLSGVSETLLIPLYNRAMESQRLDFDGWRPFEVWLGNRYFSLSNSPFAGLMRWGLWYGQEIEGWGDGIRLLDEWGFFDQPEPRMGSFRWLAPIFRLFKPMRIFHFQLGRAVE